MRNAHMAMLALLTIYKYLTLKIVSGVTGMTKVESTEEWLRVGSTLLNVEIEFSPPMRCLDSVVSKPVALIPYFGTFKGTLIFDHMPTPGEQRQIAKVVFDCGYTASYFGTMVRAEEFCLDDFKDVLRDWKWCGPDKEAPSWIFS